MTVHVYRIEPGGDVICDGCCKDWTNRHESGGVFGFGTKAFCPECTPQLLEDAKRFREEYAIKARCPHGKSFADWVREDLR